MMRLMLLIAICFSVLWSNGQQGTLQTVEHALDNLRGLAPLEKLHLQFDKERYILGDTVWYKAFVMDGFSGAPTPLSGIVYVELVDGNGELIQRSRLVVLGGAAHGEFVLDPAIISAGSFMVRAYSRWLLNFGADFFCRRYIDVEGDYRQRWAVDLAPATIIDSADRPIVDLKMMLRSVDSVPFSPQLDTVELWRDGQPVTSQREMVDESGQLAARLPVGDGKAPADLTLVLKRDTEVEAMLPLAGALATPHYDVQFLPESGNWLTNTPAVMGVKVVGRDGLGVNARGVVLAPDGAEIAGFHCTHKGMGRVELPPLSGGGYRARVDFPDGSQAIYPLPEPQHAGLVLHYDERLSTPDRFAVQVLGSDGAFADGLMLIGFARGAVNYAMAIKPSHNMLYVNIDKANFPEGIVHFSLVDGSGTPLAERMVYNRSGDAGLSMHVVPHREQYGTRDSIALQVKVTDADGQPVRGNFAMAVTDDSRYRASPLGESIRTQYLLSSELQGNVEEPGFYLGTDSNAPMAVDNLLLTQGWVRYDQSLLPKVAKFTHQREPFFRIAGTVKNGFGNPLANTEIALAAVGKTPFTMDTVSDENGVFQFEHFPPFDTLGFIIQARNRRGRSFNVGVELAPDVERMVTPRINWQAAERFPWYVNLDGSTQRAIAAQREQLRNTLLRSEGVDIRVVMLEEATVTGRRAVRGSKNLNGPGNADQVIGEEELMEQGTKTLLQILAEQVDGFAVGRFPRRRYGKPAYTVNGRPLKIVFDGMDIDRFYDPLEGMPENDHLLFVKGCLEGYTVDELVGVEVMTSTSYSSRYNTYVLPASDLVAPSGQEQLAQTAPGSVNHPGSVNPLSKTSAVMGLNPVYIEVTTRAGLGLYNRTTPGLVHFRPMPFVWPRQFYKPRYAAGAPDNDRPDFRSTIHWEPFIITDEHGEATVSFYAGDFPGTYTVCMQGLDDRGNLGVSYTQFPVAD